MTNPGNGNGDNGRVTLAILATKIDNLQEHNKIILQKIEEYHKDAEQNTAGLRSDAKEHESRLRHIEVERIPVLDKRVSLVENSQSRMLVGQSAFTAIAAVIAGWFGAKT